MPRIETLAFWFCSFWVCFFGGCSGVFSRHDCKTTDAQYTVNETLNNRTNRHTTELMSLRSEVKQESIDQNKHHMYHLNSHCKVIDRIVCLEDRVKMLEGRTVLPTRTIDRSEIDPIPPQKLPVAPND